MAEKHNIDENNNDFREFFTILQRHGKLLGLVAAACLILGGAIIYMLPDIYLSRSEILIEQESMFSRDGESKADQNISPRVHAIVKTVMTKNNIEALLRKYDLVSDATSEVDLQAEINGFRDDIKLEFENVEVLNPYTGREGKVSIGFSVEYENQSPQLAYDIANEITTLLLHANDGKVSTEEEHRLTFLNKEMNIMLVKLKKEEEIVAAFKDKNLLHLPSVNPIAVSRYEQLKAKVLLADDNVQILKQRERGLLIDLSTIQAKESLYTQDGKQVEGAAKRLLELESEYIEKSLEYTESHPEIVRLKNEINSLERQFDSPGSGLMDKLTAAHLELANARNAYTNSHPTVIQLKKKVNDLEGKIASKSRGKRKSKSVSITSNPAYMQLSVRLDDARAEISQETIRRKGLEAEIRQVEEQLQKMPYVEQKLLVLERDLDRTSAKYKEVEAKLSQAELLRSMSQANLFDRFVLVGPPELPVKPVKPKKKIMFAVLTLLSIAAALLTVFLREWFNNKITGRHILDKYGYSPVYTIPRFE